MIHQEVGQTLPESNIVHLKIGRNPKTEAGSSFQPRAMG